MFDIMELYNKISEEELNVLGTMFLRIRYEKDIDNTLKKINEGSIEEEKLEEKHILKLVEILKKKKYIEKIHLDKNYKSDSAYFPRKEKFSLMKDYYDMFSRLGLLYRKDYSLTEKGKAVLRHYLKSLEKE